MNAEKELRELDAWIADHVMEWHPVQSVHDLNSKEDFCVSGVERNVWIVDQGPNIRKFSPTTDPAAAMQVLEKCAKETIDSECIHLGKTCPTEWVVGHGAIEEVAATLPLAICLFAKELFTP